MYFPSISSVTTTQISVKEAEQFSETPQFSHYSRRIELENSQLAYIESRFSGKLIATKVIE